PRRKPKAKEKREEASVHKPAGDEFDEEDAPERRSFVSLGYLYHFLYALRARIALLPSLLLGLLFRRAHRVVALQHDPAAVRLAEAHSEPYPNPADDQAEEIEDEEEEEEEAPKPRARPAARIARNRKGDYDLPSLALLSAPKATDRMTLSDEAIEEN